MGDTISSSKRRVLVVDDDPVIREVCCRLLEAGGFQVEDVEDGPSAIQRLQQLADSPELVLLDMTMPGMNGVDVVVEMERLCLLHPVIITSGYSDDEVRERLPSDRVRGYLRKPYSFRELIDCVQSVIRETPA
ncbi:MAG: response regulator [Calditrichaeota bacterium]|nr:response regulator [Calditrichota bacterium]